MYHTYIIPATTLVMISLILNPDLFSTHEQPDKQAF